MKNKKELDASGSFLFFLIVNKAGRSDPIFFLKQLDEVTFITKTQGVTCFIDGHSGR